jgi:type IV pilus assembly protein PilM
MWTLNSGRPTQCLKIGGRTVAWAESSKTWRGRHRVRCALSPLPQGVVKLSPIDENVIDRTALEERLRSLAGPPRRLRLFGRTLLSDLPRRVTLVLPDLAVRSTVLQLEEVPVRRDEQEALIRWRLGQDQRLPLTGAKLHWQIFPPRHPKQSVHTVLVVAIQESILAEYEATCEAAGLLLQEVTVASFRLFDLWLKAAGGTRCLNRDLAWMTVSDGGLTCLIIHDGRPVFVRTKLLGGDPHSGEDAASQESLARIIRETELSIQTCQEHVPDLRLAQVVLVTEHDLPGLEDQLGQGFGVPTDHLQWEHVETAGWSHDGGNTSLTMLPVVAGLM